VVTDARLAQSRAMAEAWDEAAEVFSIEKAAA
jgi:hypothetical protein